MPFLGSLGARPDLRRGGFLLGILIGLFVTASATLQVVYAERITIGVRAMGLDLGGRTRDQARELVGAEIQRLLARPVILRTEGQEWHFLAGELGIGVDPDPVVESAFTVGHAGNPLQRVISQWLALSLGERLQDPVLELDAERLRAHLSAIANVVDRPARDADLDFVVRGGDVAVAVVPEQTGTQLRVADSLQRIRQAAAGGLPASINLVIETHIPRTSSGDLLEARARAEGIVAAPLTLVHGDRRWSLSRADLAQMLYVDRSSGQPAQLAIKPQVFSDRLAPIARELEQPAINARFEFTGSGVRLVRASQDGRALDVEVLATELRDRLARWERSIVLPVALRPATVRSTDGPTLGIKGLIREGRTSFAGSVREKAHNIRLAASRLHGTVVPPGEMFSFNREVGPTTLDAGYQTGWGITLSSSGARTIPSVAGGICQLSTTLFQPVFHAGYTIEERNYHLYWINSYGQPPLGMRGLDATVDEEAGLDLKFINTTPDYLLIHARVEGSNLVFGLYGTKPSWDVKIEGPVITNVVPADRTVVRQPEPSMPAGRTLQVEAAQDGLQATIIRTVSQGDDVRTLRLTSRYLPSRNVILYGPAAEGSITEQQPDGSSQPPVVDTLTTGR